ncbi:MAG: hypothetical protein M3P00_03430 [Gemmatimonadota bacterium]|nr:hypothetical protein [Gemmatimonadota bacterium]
MVFTIRICLSGLVLALSVRTAFAIPQVNVSERRVLPPVSRSDAFSGAIEYSFDTALNKTSARLETTLGSRHALARVLLGPPTVHTLIAAYDFRGRVQPDYPDSIRLTLISDEFEQASSDYVPVFRVVPILAVSVGDTVFRYPLAIAQMTVELPAPNLPSRVSLQTLRDAPIGYSQQFTHEIHIARTATASIPICDFLTIVSARNVQGTAAGLDFDLDEAVVSGLRAFAAKMNPDAVRDGIHCR